MSLSESQGSTPRANNSLGRHGHNNHSRTQSHGSAATTTANVNGTTTRSMHAPAPRRKPVKLQRRASVGLFEKLDELSKQTNNKNFGKDGSKFHKNRRAVLGALTSDIASRNWDFARKTYVVCPVFSHHDCRPCASCAISKLFSSV